MMYQQGKFFNVDIWRQNQIADDEAGGAQVSGYTLVCDGRAMIAQRATPIEFRLQGLGTDLLYDASVQPATLDIQSNDILTPTSGPYEMIEFRVTAVQRPQMRLQSPRASLKLQLERYDSGKILAVT